MQVITHSCPEEGVTPGHVGPRDKPWRWPEAEEGGAVSGAFLAVSPGRNGLGLASLNDFGSLWGRGDCP